MTRAELLALAARVEARDPTMRSVILAAAEHICCYGHGCEHKRGLVDGPCCAEWQLRRASLVTAAALRAMAEEAGA